MTLPPTIIIAIIKNRQSMTAFGNAASVITYNVIFNHAGTKDVTIKQHFGKIPLRKLRLWGNF